jgi:hypothetical protein
LTQTHSIGIMPKGIEMQHAGVIAHTSWELPVRLTIDLHSSTMHAAVAKFGWHRPNANCVGEKYTFIRENVHA